MIYLASPYSHPDPKVRHGRFKDACRALAHLLKYSGDTYYSPIVHHHPLVEYEMPTGWDFWENHDKEMLRMCSHLAILLLNGWEESKGVLAEYQIARYLGIEVFAISTVDYDTWLEVEYDEMNHLPKIIYP